MSEDVDFIIGLEDLSDSELKTMYRIACRRLNSQRKSSKNVNTTQKKLSIITAEMIVRGINNDADVKNLIAPDLNTEIEER